ncbi:MAG TPA: hypothetical protein VL220_10075 [Steroidobacteraceae bacterium]|nr:hypothetical protein [Steroidobacteraceae bacterium]
MDHWLTGQHSLSTTIPGDLPEALREASRDLDRIGISAEADAWTLLQRVENETSVGPVAALKESAGLDGDVLERLLIWHAARHAVSELASLPVENTVRAQLDRDLRQLHASNVSIVIGSYQFVRAAKMATLRRFSAGPMEWEIGGIPRSSVLKADFPDNLRLLAFVTFQLGGWAPCFFMHVAPTPRNRGLTVPKLVMRAYYRMARSLQLQPTVRALMAHAWFHDPAAVRDYPHLQVLNQPYVEHGGLITTLDAAPPSSGVLEGNHQRKADYIAGKVVYRYGLALWPRAAAIRWADAHPEYAE